MGIRVSVYLQGFLAIFSALVRYTAADSYVGSEVMELGKDGIVTLLTGASLILSGIIEAKTHGLTVYHSLLLLNLSWITVFTAMPSSFMLIFETMGGHEFHTFRKSHHGYWVRAVQLATLHTLHLSFTAGFGLWLFLNIETFDNSKQSCTSTTVFDIFGHYPLVDGAEFRHFWVAVYWVAVIPVINLGLLVVATLGGIMVAIPFMSIVEMCMKRHGKLQDRRPGKFYLLQRRTLKVLMRLNFTQVADERHWNLPA